MIVQLEWRGLGTVKNIQVGTVDFNLTSGHIAIHRSLTPGTDFTSYLENVFRANLVRLRKKVTGIWIKNHLHNAFAISQIEKYNATMIPSTINPTADCNFLINVCACYQPTIGSSIHQ
jgi:hypothetical protein